MKNAQTPHPLQSLLSRLAEELKDALLALRAAESEVQFELEILNLERMVRDMEGA